MTKRLAGAVLLLLGIIAGGVAGAGSASATHTTCHGTTPFLGNSNGEANEDGLVSGTIHDHGGERVEQSLNPDNRPVHYINCTIVAPCDPTSSNPGAIPPGCLL